MRGRQARGSDGYAVRVRFFFRRRTRDGDFGRSLDERFLRAMDGSSRAGSALLPGPARISLVARAVSLLALLAVTTGISGAGAAFPGFTGFRTPSKNIVCGHLRAAYGSPETLRCDIFSGLRPEPRRACDLDWTGISMRVNAARRPHVRRRHRQRSQLPRAPLRPYVVQRQLLVPLDAHWCELREPRGIRLLPLARELDCLVHSRPR